MEELIKEERARQDAKWGEQNHDPVVWVAILMEEIGEMSKVILETSTFKNPATFVENELIQCAAVLKAMWESGKRNGWL